jgi:hypothetical protein
MIWHIFKKDWKLLWIFAVAVALINWVAEFVVYKMGLFGEYPMLELLSEQLPVVAMFANMFLVAAIVHLDAIPGLRQDWLVRPIRRRDLLLEKLIFAIVTVAGPIFVANLAEGLASHFSLQESLLAATGRVGYLLVLIILPLFILGSVTQNMTEAFIFGCGCTFVIGVFITLVDYSNRAAHLTLMPVLNSGVGWIGEVFRFGIVLVASAVILRLQFFRRKTFASRVLVVAFGLLLLFSMFFPWGPAFAIEQRLSENRSVGTAIQLRFDPAAGRYRKPSGLNIDEDNRSRGDNAEVFLPIRIAGVHANGILLSDRADIRLINPNGSVVYHGNGEDMEFDSSGPNPPNEPGYQEIEIRQSGYRINQDQPLRAEVNYSLTAFRLSKSYAIPALGGDERMPGWGWCKTKPNEAGTAVELHCMQAGKGPICGSVVLENEATGVRNPERSACGSNYTPFGDRPLPDNFARFGVNLPFRDPSGLAKFPVDGSQLPQSRVVIRVYEPEDHFTRSLVIPQIKLKDWEAQ